MTELPPGFAQRTVANGDVKLNVVHNRRDGGDERPGILFLHGFPEYWAGWLPAAGRLAGDFLVVAPDQRGYNLSDAPQAVEAYAPKLLCGDALAVADAFFGDRPFFLAGHDWGAAVAYALAIVAPRRLAGLIVVNGVHPVLFQRALIEDREQREASQYFHVLRDPGAAQRLSEDGFARALSMFERFSSSPWLTDALRDGYRSAWRDAAHMNAMLNWYRASSVTVPRPGEAAALPALAERGPDTMGIAMPHLLVWGEGDQALRPSSTAGLAEFAPDLEIVRISGGDHWVIHTHGGTVAGAIADFCARCGRA